MLGLPLRGNNLSIASQRELVTTHKKVPAPPVMNPGNELLLVALKSYLGRGTTFSNSAQELNLKSSGQHLILKDANGIVHKSNQIKISWRKTSLEPIQRISRQVAGPFASFESAQRFASKLPINNTQVYIAHPLDWEVWIPTNIDLPSGILLRKKEEDITFEIRPVLKVRSSEILLKGPIAIDAPDGLIWNGGIYAGPFVLKPDAYGSWTFIEHVPLERYLEGVVPFEIGSNSPQAALSAQAVLARTWALANHHRFMVDGYHLCSDVQCQVYKKPNEAPLKVKNAILKTSGRILKWKGKPISAVYHATNGGVMASIAEAWSVDSLPYFKSRLDGSYEWTKQFTLPLISDSSIKRLLESSEGAYGKEHRLFRWRRIYTSGQLKNDLQANNPTIKIKSLQSVSVLQRGVSGRVLSLELIPEDASQKIVLHLDNIRKKLRKLPSTLFVVNELKEGVWEFVGGGFGHGAGMSQAGAIELAYKGWSVEQILNHYYPGAKYGSLHY